jgi:ligand-binding sensor domain-containing protein
MENWMVLDAEDGLVDNLVQSITVDHQGRVWIGTSAGVCVFENNSLKSFSRGDGILGKNVMCISVDREGIVWIGTERGVTSYQSGDITRYMN